jgi:hypothetical protein
MANICISDLSCDSTEVLSEQDLLKTRGGISGDSFGGWAVTSGFSFPSSGSGGGVGIGIGASIGGYSFGVGLGFAGGGSSARFAVALK